MDNGDNRDDFDELPHSNGDNENEMDDTQIETEPPTNDTNFAPSSSYRSQRRRIEDYENVAVVDTSEDVSVGQLYQNI